MATFNSANSTLQSGNKTLFEVSMLADQYGHVGAGGSLSSTVFDAFGRMRVSNPFTMFDSNHRYKDNGLWATSNTSTANASHSSNEGLINLNVDNTSNAEVIRETYKVFAYQPGKSLLVLNSFTFNTAKANLRQRVGYFGAQNGFFLEQDGTNVYLVKRSNITGSVVDTKVAQTDWNIDKMDGTGRSKITLNLSKSQLLWMDLEWLGVGSVRIGFVHDGNFIQCHTFHHANYITGTYITTASLPLRCEIKNTNTTSSNSTLKQICSTVMSEGGYSLMGTQQAIGIPLSTPYTLTTAGTTYPVISLRLKSTPDRLDAIAILTAASILGLTNNANYRWSIVANANTSGGSWVSASADSAIEYNITGTSVTYERILASGYTQASNQGPNTVDILKQALFANQLDRNGLTSTPREISLVLAASINGATALASLDWEEVTR